MRKALLAFLSAFLVLPLYAQVTATFGDRFVNQNGGRPVDGCNGKVNVVCGGLVGGPPAQCANAPNCAFSQPTHCASSTNAVCGAGGICYISAGDTCFIQPGSYVGNSIAPVGNGTAGNPMSFVCDQSTTTGECFFNGGSSPGISIDFRGKNYAEFRGGGTLDSMFVIDAGAAGGKIHGWNGTGNKFEWIRTTDRDGLGPFVQFETAGGNLNSISNSILYVPQYGTTFTGTVATPYAQGLNAAAAETNTTATNVYVLGGRNSMSFNNSTDFVFNGGIIAGSQNHSTNWCNGGTGCIRPVFKNVVFALDATFREPNPQILGDMDDPTFLNDLFMPGTRISFDSHGCDPDGTLTYKNNLVFGYDTKSKDNPLAHWTSGSYDGNLSTCVVSQSCTAATNLPNWSVDYNGYSPYFSTLSGSDNKNIASTMWTVDFDNDTCPLNVSAANNYTGNQFNAYKADPKILSRSIDQNSRMFLNLDLDSAQLVRSTGATSTKMYGTTGPLWGAHVEGNYSSPALTLDLYPPVGTNDSAPFTANTQSFCAVEDWTGTQLNNVIHVNDFFIFGSDVRSGGKIRQITSITADGNCGNQGKAGLKITFTPALDWNNDGFFQSATTGAPFAADKPIYNVGTTNGGSDFALFYGFPDLNSDGISDFTAGQAFTLDNLSYTPVAGSALIDAGDPSTCGSTAVDGDGDTIARCDIGPGEFTGVAPPNNNITLAIADAAITEGTGAGTTTLVFRVSQNQTSTAATTFTVNTQGSSAIEGTDYTGLTAFNTQVDICPTMPCFEDVSVTINRDALYENAEFFNITISNAATTEAGKTASITDATATGTIGNDDALPTLSISNQTVTEGATATFTGTLSAAAGTVLQVDYNTVDGTAKSTSPDPDFTAVSGTWTFSAGQTVKTVDVSTIDDSIVESPPSTEQATLNLVGSVPGLVSNSPLLIITDNDTLASITNLTIRGGGGRGLHFNGTSSTSTALLPLGAVSVTSNISAGATSGISYCDLDTVPARRQISISGILTSSGAKNVCLYNYPKTAGSDLGVIITLGGGPGTALWSSGAHASNATEITNLRGVGYRFVQVAFESPGSLLDPSATDGATSPRHQAGFFATIIKYIEDNYTNTGTIPLCVIGNSNGADATGYALSDYGLYTYIDAVYLGSGPISTKTAEGCNDAILVDGGACPKMSDLGYPASGHRLIDQEHGYASSGGPCDNAPGTPLTTPVASWFNQNSLAFSTTGGTACADHGVFYFPHTYTSFRYGALDSPETCSGTYSCNAAASDCGNAPNHADLYYEELTNGVRSGATTCHATQTNVDQSVIASANHQLNDTAGGVTDWSTWVYTGGAANKCKAW